MNEIIIDDGKYLNPKRFTGLIDTPDNFIGKSGQTLVVKETEDGLEFIDISDLGKNNLYELNDVNFSGLTLNEIIIYDGNKWVNSVIPTQELDLEDLQNVEISGATINQVLSWNGSVWVNETIIHPSIPQFLTDLDDVEISGATNGQVLTYSGGTWYNLDPQFDGSDYVKKVTIEGDRIITQDWNGTDNEYQIVVDNSVGGNSKSGLKITEGYVYIESESEIDNSKIQIIANDPVNTIYFNIYDDAGDLKQVLFGHNNVIVFQEGGVNYAFDISANYTDRTLVDKGYVDTQITGVTTYVDNTVNNLVLDDLSNVNVSGATTDQIIKFDGANWVNTDQAGGDVTFENTIIVQGGGTDKIYQALTDRIDKFNTLIVVYPGEYTENQSYVTDTANENVYIYLHQGARLTIQNTAMDNGLVRVNSSSFKIDNFIIDGNGELNSTQGSSGRGLIDSIGSSFQLINYLYVKLYKVNRSLVGNVYSLIGKFDINIVSYSGTASYLIEDLRCDSLTVNINYCDFGTNYGLFNINDNTQNFKLEIGTLAKDTAFSYFGYSFTGDEMEIIIRGDELNTFELTEVVLNNSEVALGGKSHLKYYKKYAASDNLINIEGDLAYLNVGASDSIKLTNDVLLNRQINNWNIGNNLELDNCNLYLDITNMAQNYIFRLNNTTSVDFNNSKVMFSGDATGKYIFDVDTGNTATLNFYNNNYSDMTLNGGAGTLNKVTKTPLS